MQLIRFPILLLTILLAGCASNDLELEPTISSLEEITLQIEPAANFEIDRKQVIDSYRALVEITVDGGGTGDELRRLADLELESSLDNKLSDNIETQKQGNQESSRAIQTYQKYLKKYPKRVDNDLILYQLSRAYAMEAQSEKSLQILNRIAKHYPNSKYIDEVQFRRGEELFVAREYQEAESAYGTIVKNHPDSPYYTKATYKYGWAQFKQGDSRRALDSFIRLLDLNAASGKVDEIGFSSHLPRTERESSAIAKNLSMSWERAP
jgi:tetratricopeptide (TPR) repeat protein